MVSPVNLLMQQLGYKYAVQSHNVAQECSNRNRHRVKHVHTFDGSQFFDCKIEMWDGMNIPWFTYLL